MQHRIMSLWPPPIPAAGACARTARSADPGGRRPSPPGTVWTRVHALGPTAGGGRQRLWRRLRFVLLAVGFVIVCLLPTAAWWIASLGPAPLGEGLAYSALVVDRQDRLLRPYTTPDGRWRLRAIHEDI